MVVDGLVGLVYGLVLVMVRLGNFGNYRKLRTAMGTEESGTWKSERSEGSKGIIWQRAPKKGETARPFFWTVGRLPSFSPPYRARAGRTFFSRSTVMNEMILWGKV